MTEVLSIASDNNSHFGSPLRRSSSSTSFLLQQPPSYTRSNSSLKSRYSALGYDTSRLPASLPSSAPSSPLLTAPAFSNQPSFTSTPSSSLSLDDQYAAPQQDDVVFPSYQNADFLDEICDAAPAPSPESLDSPAPSPSYETPSHTKIPSDILEHAISAGDDTAIADAPTRHVDYLSHNWKEEDIWASWRHIVTRRGSYSNSPRLENASWRTWTKAKYGLKTVTPEALNWLVSWELTATVQLMICRMKDHDVTWLYGPLQTGRTKLYNVEPTPRVDRLSRNDSFVSKKPILKKRSLSELMLQRSLSSSTLMKQATDSIRAQSSAKPQHDRPVLQNRQSTDFGTLEVDTPLTQANSNPSPDPSTSSSGIQTPCTKRHIHFNDKVEQCIAINEDCDDHPCNAKVILDDSDSDDDMLVMKPVQTPTKAKISKNNSPRGSFSNESKTIAMLPSTTLNYRGDTPEPGEKEPHYPENKRKPDFSVPSSSSQQTLRPSIPSANFLLDDEDDADMNWQPTSARRGSVFPREIAPPARTDDNDNLEGSGLSRTPSGMFMPYEDGDEYANAGLLGRVVDTVNTAKDIAHVIWNVGWRR